MCGILAIFSGINNSGAKRSRITELSSSKDKTNYTRRSINPAATRAGSSSTRPGADASGRWDPGAPRRNPEKQGIIAHADP
ncbi:hypothetical protein NL676_013902 [Syzygium grande]|nr:hypothetical protein NL676_013902 [Syzygium grande]